MEQIKIKVADYYGVPSYYSVMPEPIFDALERAFLNCEDAASVDKWAFDKMVSDYERINPRALERVLPPETAKGGGLKGFCDEFGFNRTKYSRIKNSFGNPNDEMLYKYTDVDAPAALCGKYGVSAEWLMLGVGEMRKEGGDED